MAQTKHNLFQNIQNHKIWGILFAFALIYVASGFHGFSLPIWKDIIGDENGPTMIVSGKTRGVRTDDFLSSIPMAMAQLTHRPPYPLTNTLIGQGEPMLVLPYAPVAHPLILFRPHTWGFFLGPDIGLSWWWLCRVGGVFVSALLLCQVIFKKERFFQFLLPLILVFSPFVQFWSANMGEMIFHAIISALCIFKILTGRSRVKQLFYGVLLGYCAAAEALLLYPAYAVPLAYAVIAITISLLIRERPQKFGLQHLSSFTLSLVIIIATGCLFWFSAGDAIRKITTTAYPGMRLSLGGDLSIAKMMSAWTIVDNGILRDLGGNICEGAFFFFLSPLILLLVARDYYVQRDVQISKVLAPLFFALVLLITWATVGGSEIFAKLSFLGMVPSARTAIGLGVLDFCILAFYLSSASNDAEVKTQKWKLISVGILILVATGLFFLFQSIHRMVPSFHEKQQVLAFCIATSIAAALIFSRFRVATGLLLAASLFMTFKFNPIARGGSEYIYHNDLSRSLMEISRSQVSSVWAVDELDDIAQLPRMLGLKSINGYQNVPQLELWEKADPSGSYRSIYNRYAKVKVRLTQESNSIAFISTSPDAFEIHMRPSSENAKLLGFNRILTTCSKDEKLFSENGWSLKTRLRNHCIWMLME